MTTLVLTKEKGFSSVIVRDISLVLLGTFILALCARVAIFLPISPVPISLQNFGVILMGILLGSRRGACCIAAYLMEGAIGLPVFGGGQFSVAVLIGTRGGYLFSFVFAAYLAGRMFEKPSSYVMPILKLSSIFALILILGASWLSLYVGASNAIFMGVLPFIIGDFIKVLAITSALPALLRFSRKYLCL